MCRPSPFPSRTTTDKHENGTTIFDDQQRLVRATWLGAASCSLVFIANAVIMPHQQSRRDAMGCDYLCVGSLSSARSGVSLVGAAVVGSWSDALRGRRHWLLWMGSLASAVAIACDARATGRTDLWYGIVPSALQQNLSVCKALLGDYYTDNGSSKGSSSAGDSGVSGTSEGDRAWSAGMLGMAAGLAMMIGPLVGAMVLTTYTQAIIAGLFCLVLSASLLLFLPATPSSSSNNGTTTPNATAASDNKKKWQWQIPHSARSPGALFLLAVKLVSGLSFHMFQTIWAVYMKETLQFGPSDYGRFFSTIGFCYAVSQGLLARRVVARWGQARGRLLAVVSLAVGVTRYAAVQCDSSQTGILAVYALFAAKVTVYGVFSTIITADVSTVTPPAELGTFFGVLTAVEQSAGMLGPLLGGALGYYGHPSMPLAAVLCMNLGLAVVVWTYYDRFVVRSSSVGATKKSD